MLPSPIERALVSYPDRRFQLWAYTVSHGSLLLRSTKTDDEPTRVDVLFRNVKAHSTFPRCCTACLSPSPARTLPPA